MLLAKRAIQSLILLLSTDAIYLTQMLSGDGVKQIGGL